MPDRAQSDKIVRLAAVMEALGERVVSLTSEVSGLRGELQSVKDSTLTELKTRSAVQAEQIKRMSWIVYGTAGALGIETLGIIGAIIVWAVTRTTP